MRRAIQCGLVLWGLAELTACTSVPANDSQLATSPWAGATAGDVDTSAWEHHTFPGKRPTQFTYMHKDGRDAMAAVAASSASMLRQKVRIEAADLGHVRFSWRVPQLIAQADMALREADDSPVRVVLAFEGDRSRFSAKNAMMSELVHALTGEELPYATLMYAWCNQRAPGSVIASPRTDRIRTLVVQSGPGGLDRWIDYERNIRADFEKAFGEAPGALVGIGIMTDTDNTRSSTQAWYGPVQWVPTAAATLPAVLAP